MSFTPGEPDPPDGPGRFGCHTDAEIREKLVSPDKNARGTWMVRLHGREGSYVHRVGGTSELYEVVEMQPTISIHTTQEINSRRWSDTCGRAANFGHEQRNEGAERIPF